MDIPALFGSKVNDESQQTADVSVADDASTDNISTADDGSAMKFVKNETIATADQSDIGDEVKTAALNIKPTNSADDFNVGDLPETGDDSNDDGNASGEPEIPVDIPSIPEPIDPDKETFIKAYTEEFDAAVYRATSAAKEILDAIDTAIRARAADINIPMTADEFLDKPVHDHKVQKFEDARAVVSAVMDKANEAKQKSADEAKEAAQIYDEVQQFKHDTEDQITSLTSDFEPDEIEKFKDEDVQGDSSDDDKAGVFSAESKPVRPDKISDETQKVDNFSKLGQAPHHQTVGVDADKVLSDLNGSIPATKFVERHANSSFNLDDKASDDADSSEKDDSPEKTQD